MGHVDSGGSTDGCVIVFYGSDLVLVVLCVRNSH